MDITKISNIFRTGYFSTGAEVKNFQILTLIFNLCLKLMYGVLKGNHQICEKWSREWNFYKLKPLILKPVSLYYH